MYKKYKRKYKTYYKGKGKGTRVYKGGRKGKG